VGRAKGGGFCTGWAGPLLDGWRSEGVWLKGVGGACWEGAGSHPMAPPPRRKRRSSQRSLGLSSAPGRSLAPPPPRYGGKGRGSTQG